MPNLRPPSDGQDETGPPGWTRQHRIRHALWKSMARVGLTGLHGLPLNRLWIDLHRQSMPLAGLDPAFEGYRLVQVSDLHYSPVVWEKYLVQHVRWINDLRPDLVVVTGDLITGGYRYARRVARILAHLQTRDGVVCTFGNHDYSVYGRNRSPEGVRRAAKLEEALLDVGLQVLRNQALRIERPGVGRPLTIVGLDDEWSGHIDPDLAWQGVSAECPIVCLNHNPANVLSLMRFPWQWMLSGHTHGRQVGHGRLSKRVAAHRYRHYTHGYYAVQGRHLYVNRGLAYGQRVRDWCRPEITVFSLQPS